MSYSSRGPVTLSTSGEIPRGEVIGRYSTYAQAQKAVDYLADQQFEVDKVSIIGSDLKSVEQVTGRLSYPKVALQGALNGVVFGAFFGLLMSLLGGTDLAQSLLLPIVMGGAFWMLLATITYAMQRGKRDFTSTNRTVAGSYEVIAAPEVAGEARHVLGGLNLGQQPAGRGQQGGWNQPPNGNPGRQGHWGPAPGQYGSQNPQGPRGYHPPQAGPPPSGGHSGAGQEHGPGGCAQVPPSPGAQQPQAPAGQQEPAYGQRIQGEGAQHAQAGRSAKFPDLPDGRPQYGIRLEPEDPAQAPAPGQQGAPTGHNGSAGVNGVTGQDTASTQPYQPNGAQPGTQREQTHAGRGSTSTAAPWSHDQPGQDSRERHEQDSRERNE